MTQAAKKKKIFDGRYEILSIVGRGARSVVYHARHVISPSSEVALKVLLSEKGKVPLADKLRKEALAMVSSRHRYVVRLDDFHSIGDLCYLSMEFAPESDLRKYTAKSAGKLPLAQAELFFTQCAKGLDFIHKVGITHRDIKPDNILVINQKEIRIADFGIATLAGEELVMEDLQAGIGTLDYLAPEVLEAKACNAGSDIYALGLSFYEMLSGTHPFADTTLIRQLEVREDKNLPHINTIVKDLAPYFSEAIMKCLRYDASARFQSAGELVQHLLLEKSRRGMPTKERDNTASQPRHIQQQAPTNPRKDERAPQADNRREQGGKQQPQQPQPHNKDRRDFQPKPEPRREEKFRLNDRNDRREERPFDKPNAPKQADGKNLHAPQAKPNQQPKFKDRPNVSSQPLPQDQPTPSVTPKPPEIQPRTTLAAPPKEPALEPIEPEKVTVRQELPDSGALAAPTSSAIESTHQTKKLLGEAKSVLQDIAQRARAAIPPERLASLAGDKNIKNIGIGVLVILLVVFLIPGLINGVSRISSYLFSGSDNGSENIALENETVPEIIPVFEARDFAFPFLAPGLYSGEIHNLVPGEKFPLTLISMNEGNRLVVLVGMEGWTPAVIELGEKERATWETNPQAPLQVASNGLILKLTGQHSEGQLVGYFRNIVTGDEGEWQAQAPEVNS